MSVLITELITTDELIAGKQNIVEAKKEDKKTKFARNLAISVGLYILSLVAIILFSALFEQEIIGVCLFFTIIAVATGLIFFTIGAFLMIPITVSKKNRMYKVFGMLFSYLFRVKDFTYEKEENINGE